MPITLQIEPDTTYPLGVEDCIYYELLPDDFITTNGIFASILIDIEQTGAAQANSDYITIMGINFIVSSASDYTYATYDGTVADGLQHANNLANALRNNYNFNNYDINVSTVGSTHIVSIQARNFDEPENWEVDTTNLSYVYPTIVSTGTRQVTYAGYKVFHQFFTDANEVVIPIQAATPSIRESLNLVEPIPLELQDALSSYVRTTLPDLNDSTWFYDSECYGDFYLKYGSGVDSEAGCGPTFREFLAAPTIRVINFATQPNDPEYFEPYFYDAVDQPKAKFLTTQPATRFACSDSSHWLWFYAHIGETLMPGFGLDHYELSYTFYSGNSLVAKRVEAIGNQATDQANTRVLVVACGPGNMNVTPPTLGTWDNYTVEINATSNGGNDNNFVSEVVHFRVHDCGEKTEQIVFLTSKTGYATMECLQLKSISMSSDGNEICRDVDCGGTFAEKLTQGRMNIGGRAYEKMTFETTVHPSYLEDRAFLADFKASQVRYLVIEDTTGTQQFRRLLIEPGSLKIWEYQKKIKATFTAVFAQDYKRLSEG